MDRSEPPAFYFDLASPEAYIAAERIIAVMPTPCDWQPILAARLPNAETFEAFRCATEEEIILGELGRRVAAAGLQPLVLPDPFPFDSDLAMLAATYAKQIGRVTAFAQAAFRQAFAGGHALSDRDTVLIAAAACEMHPTAVLKALERRAIREELERASAAAIEAGVLDVPAVRVGGTVVHGAEQLGEAAELAAAVAR